MMMLFVNHNHRDIEAREFSLLKTEKTPQDLLKSDDESDPRQFSCTNNL